MQPCCDVFQIKDGNVVSFLCYLAATALLGQLGMLGNLGVALALIGCLQFPVRMPMIERRSLDKLPVEDLGWLKVRRHVVCSDEGDLSPGGWGCMRAWNEEEVTSNAGFGPEKYANIEIITYVCEGAVTHRDSFGSEVKVKTGNVQVLSAGTGIRRGEYNLEPASARIFRIWIAPASPGGAPAWGVHPCPPEQAAGCFVPIASGFRSDREALPIRGRARVLKAKLRSGQTITYVFRKLRLAYLVSSSGVVDINGVRICARDGAAIKDEDLVTITAIEEADLVMVDVH
jgi:quercetin 2,3-dioxygenase